MHGSTIIHYFEQDKALDDIELLPFQDSMIDLIALNQKRTLQEENNNINNNQGEKNGHGTFKPMSFVKRIRRRRQIAKDTKNTLFPFYGSTQHIERMNLDIRHLSLSIAGNIDNQEQWKEFFEDTQGEGLYSISQCVRDCADEINLGYAADIFDDNNDVSMLDREKRRENAFVAACSAIKVLRDLCSIDQNWASVMTDEILAIDQKWRNENGGVDGGGFLQDLAIVLKYTNEEVLFYSRKIGRKRRELRAHGITIKRFGTRKQRRSKFCL